MWLESKTRGGDLREMNLGGTWGLEAKWENQVATIP